MRQLIRTTLIGGVIFLIPLVFVVAVVGKAIQIMKSVAVPLSELLPVESVAGVAVVPILIGIILFLSCLIAGLLARSAWGKRLYAKVDNVLLQMIPGYAWVKGLMGDISIEEAEEVFKPVLIKFDDQYQLGFEVERAVDGLVTVYMPGSPDPRSGTVSYVTSDRIQSVEGGFKLVTKISKNFGRGSTEMVASRQE